MDPLEQFKQTFFEECDELLADLEGHLLAIEERSTDSEVLHATFRAIHSIKGGAWAFGFDRLVAFTHAFESVLDQVREGSLALSEDLTATIVRAGDVVVELVRAAREGRDLEAGHETEVLDALNKLAAGDREPGGDSLDDLDFTPVPAGQAARPDTTEESREQAPYSRYRIRFRPTSEMFKRAHEPLLFVRELKRLGAVIATPDLFQLPRFEDLDPEAAYLSWTFELETSASRMLVEEIFEFVTEDCDLVFDSLTEVSPEGPEPASKEEPESKEPTESDADDPAPATAEDEAGEGNTASSGGAAATAVAAAAGQAAADSKSATAKLTVSSIRVDVEKIDRLVNMVGELVITQAMISQQSDHLLAERYPRLVQGLDQLQQHTLSLQDSVMAIRAQPVKTVFSRMTRMVRQLSTQTGKKARLVMSGEDTEIDKTVIELLTDPLTHMIRNAVDHGIEPSGEREKAGKAAEGTIHLSAEQRGGRIVIRIADDGRGVNREKVRRKAIERDLIPPDANLSDDEIDNLIFLPGFSTADQVSGLSGRGVGMDVVKQNIQKLGGRVAVRSEPGHGSQVIMTLPLTLAVLDGMIVRAGDESYVLPLANIIESLAPRGRDLEVVAGGGDLLRVRGSYVQLVRLRDVFEIPGSARGKANELVVLAEVEGGERIGLVVDEILGQQQIVIKSLEENFDPIPGIAGATVLGDGNVALILDVTGLRSLSNTPTRHAARTGQKQEFAA